MKTTTSQLYRIIALLMLPLLISGCGRALAVPYEPAITGTEIGQRKAPFFAEELCVAEGDVAASSLELADRTCAGLFNVTTRETLYAKNIYEKINPASLTKIMTALVAIENGDLTRTIVAGESVIITESGAQKLGLKPGDRMTLDQALHILLIYSANDVALLIAENVGGSVERFVQMMNDRAQSLGATGCHFTNPHGLTDSYHYVTAYDLYLIFNEAMKYVEFREIVNAAHYSSSYHTQDGTEIPVDIRSTNGYLTGAYTVPEGIRIVGGKTGTTAAAGHCLILYLENTGGESFVSVLMRTPDSEALDREMKKIMKSING
ncbi:MAG: D-alanyl-D-alanine carboxypeptidase [Lachnospiraceae bacterium]|nr:D-alanyl-D-alanine carboxypeptidase [Lachnospiraceae bacterium]